MKIRFNTRKSGFYNEIKSALEDSSLDSEVTVLSNDGYSYVEEEIEDYNLCGIMTNTTFRFFYKQPESQYYPMYFDHWEHHCLYWRNEA